jgi:hypothetical protein
MTAPLLPEDFYFNDEGFMVFTRAYHLKRGSCCGSGCVHCPYGPTEKSPNPPHKQKLEAQTTPENS